MRVTPKMAAMTTPAARAEEPDLLEANIGDVRDPYTAYREARNAHPVARVDHLGAKATMVYRYAEAETVLSDDGEFSARINGKWMRPLLGRTILEMDGRTHFTHRRLIGSAFRPTMAASWENTLIRPLAHATIDAFASRGSADLVREFTWQLPVRVFAEIIGVPSVDHARWQRWAIALEMASIDWARAIDASKEVHDYFQPVIEQRRANPGEDLISILASAEIEGEKLDDEMIHGFLRLLVPAGAGTTYRLLGSVLYGLLTDADQLQAVRADRSLVPKAIEEALRWESPVQFAVREANADAELGGVPIEAGTVVTVALGSANHDDDRYTDPERFDVMRSGPPPHVAFGDGPHRCLGEHLARVEARTAIDALLDRLSDLELDTSGDPYIAGYAFRSPTALPVRFTTA
jgi:cytochrome P450